VWHPVDSQPDHAASRSLRVFLSHTSELARFPKGRSFVAVAKDAIRRAGHVAVEMSDFPAYPESPAELCRERVASCDVYVGLLGFRYGSLVRDERTISYTELEFTAASGMPRLAFLLNPDAARDLPWDEDEYQRDFRARVTDSGITVKFVDSIGALELEIYSALIESVRQPADPEPAYRPPVTGREVPRPELFEPLVHQLISESRSVGLVSARLEGAGGFGKTTLAALACADPRVRTRFPEGDFWVTLGEQVHGVKLLAKVNDLIVTVSGMRQSFADLEQASQYLGRLLGSVRTLLVIDDVWDPSQLTPFLSGSCTRLIISRVRNLLPPGTVAINVDAMTEEQARNLLGNGLSGAAEVDWSGLLRHAGGWPILLELINRVVGHWVEHNKESLGSAIRRVEAELAARGPTALDPKKPKYRQQAVATTVQVSVHLLGEEHPQWPVRFAELAVFPKNTSIPLATLATYWRDNMTGDEAEALCGKLFDLSLVRQFELTGTRSLRLHDVIHDYLVHNSGERLPGLHRRLLDAHTPAQWWELAPDEPYLWDRLTYHLSQIIDGGANDLVCDLRWIEARLRRGGRSAIDMDFAHATSDRAFGLREALMRSMHLFSPLEPAPSLAATVASRLHGIEGLTEIVERYEHSRRGYWLAPVWPLLDQPPPAFRGTLATGTSGVRSFVVSRDGTWMATGHEDGTVSTWDLADGRILSSARLHEHPVTAIDITPDGGLAVSTSFGGVAWQQDPKQSPKNGYYLNYKATWSDVAADPVRPRVVICGDISLSVQFHDHAGVPQRLRTPWPRMVTDFLFGTGDRVKSNRLDHNSGRLGLAPFALLMLILLPWPANVVALCLTLPAAIIGIPILRLQLHWRRPRNLSDYDSCVYGVSFSADGTLLATGSPDGTVRLWDAVDGRLRASFTGSEATHGSIAIDGGNKWLASATNNGMFRLWNIHTGELKVAEPTSSERSMYVVVCFSAEGTWVARGIDFRVMVWTVEDGLLRASLTLPELVTCVGFTQDAQFLLTGSSSVQKWKLAELPSELPERPDDPNVRSVAFSADGSWLAIGGPENKISIRAADGTPRTTLIAPTRTVHAVAIAPDGRWLASGDGDGTVHLWNLDGTLRATLTEHTERVFAVTIAPDSSWLASGGADNTIRIWSAEGTLRTTLTGHTGDDDYLYAQGIYGLAIAEDGTWLASAGWDGTVRSWDTETWEAMVLEDHDEDERDRNIMGLHGVAISPDGSWVASAGWDDYIRMRSVRDGELRTLRAHNSRVTAVSFSPDGTLLASVEVYGVVRIWRVNRGECVAALRVNGSLWDCAWSPKGNLVAVSGTGGSYLFELRSA
jgi:WD40 repeat protein